MVCFITFVVGNWIFREETVAIWGTVSCPGLVTVTSLFISLVTSYIILLTRISLFQYLASDMAPKAMAPHSSTLAWKIPWTEEPGGLQSMGLLRVGQD